MPELKKHEHIMPHLGKWEGGLSRDVADSASRNPCPAVHNGKSGWHTNMGITWTTWSRYCKKKGYKDPIKRFFNMDKEDVSDVFKTLYWDSVCADTVNSVPVANCIAQWAWGSGSWGALKLFKRWCSENGYTIPRTWKGGVVVLNKAIDERGEKDVFDSLCARRKRFLLYISRPGTRNAKFQRGWMNRLRAFIKFNQPLFLKT